VPGAGRHPAGDLQGVAPPAAQRAARRGAYEKRTAFEENHAQLTRLKAAGVPMAILSNGTLAMLGSALDAAGLDGLLDHVLSVDSVGKFKTAPEAYQMGLDAFGLPAEDILFVSSNCWDICGAAWFGYHTIWLNRYGLPMERLGVEPMARGTSLKDVADYALASFSG
jgi:2-haloacid dehalogenase